MMRSDPLSAVLVLVLCPQLVAAETVRQSARQVPVVREVDVVVVGGTVGAVAAAIEAAGEGASVLLVAPRTYLGEDTCGTLRLWLEKDETPSGGLTKQLFGDRTVTTPMHVKKTLEAALLRAGADFLLGCYVTDVFLDGGGQPAGVVIANRAGRQAIVAKVVIDATERAVVARMAGAEHEASDAGKHFWKRVVLGGEPTSRAEPTRRIPAGVTAHGDELHYYEYSLVLDLGDGSFPAMAEAEQRARDLTYRHGQLRAAERMTTIPRDAIVGRKSAGDWQAREPWAIGHFRPGNVDRLYVLGPAADVPRSVAERLLRPDVSESLGRVVGKEAARAARKTAFSSELRWRETLDPPVSAGDVREILTGLRPTDRAGRTISLPELSVPVLAEVDVIVVGGGTTGACAAIGATRRGADVLVVEYQEGLGGVGILKEYQNDVRGLFARHANAVLGEKGR